MDKKQLLHLISALILALAFTLMILFISSLKPIQPKVITYESLLAELNQ